MTLKLGDAAPDFTADTTQGKLAFHEWLGDSWGVFFSHPKDFTPVCSTELGYLAHLKPEFDKRGAKVIALSVDPVENHQKWSKDIEDIQSAPNQSTGCPRIANRRTFCETNTRLTAAQIPVHRTTLVSLIRSITAATARARRAGR